jgi:hypothetical protein
MAVNRSPEAPRATQRIEHIFGLRRTGHHAVLAWLQDCYHAEGLTTRHENSVFNEHLGWELHSPDPEPQVVWRAAANADVLVVNYEDIAYGSRNTSPVYNALQTRNTNLPTRDTVVVRDWYNMVASRLKYIADAKAINRYTITAALDWAAVANRWLDHATMLIDTPQDTSSFVGISYNRWLTDREYRENLAASYGLSNSETTLDTVSSFGLGSSFEGLDKNDGVRAMNLLRRWENLETDELQTAYLIAINAGGVAVDGINRRLFGFDRAEVVSALP